MKEEENNGDGPVGEQITWSTQAYKISYIRPCFTDKSKKMAEARFSESVADSKEMCELLMNSRQFDNVTYSEKLGIARIEWMGKTITIFNTGEITVRSAESIEDVKSTIDKIYGILSRLMVKKEPEKKDRKYKPGEVEM
jgi:ArsR family metal-binding transcriptional regulator